MTPKYKALVQAALLELQAKATSAALSQQRLKEHEEQEVDHNPSWSQSRQKDTDTATRDKHPKRPILETITKLAKTTFDLMDPELRSLCDRAHVLTGRILRSRLATVITTLLPGRKRRKRKTPNQATTASLSLLNSCIPRTKEERSASQVNSTISALCPDQPSTSKSSTTNLLQTSLHNYKLLGEKCQTKYTNAIAYFIATDMMANNTVENEGFKHLIRTMAPGYQMPYRKTISDRAIPKLYEDTVELIKLELTQVCYVSFTADCWTSQGNIPTRWWSFLNVIEEIVNQHVPLMTLFITYDNDMENLEIDENVPSDKKQKIQTGLAAILKRKVSAVNDGVQSKAKMELEKYLKIAAPDIEENILDWWKSNERTFPRLAQLAKKNFCIQGSSVPSERVFSRGGLVVSDRRTCLSTEHVEQLPLGDRILYYDTDSIIFLHKPGEIEQPVSSFLCYLTDELTCYGPGSFITEFICGGPKNYAYKVYNAELSSRPATEEVPINAEPVIPVQNTPSPPASPVPKRKKRKADFGEEKKSLILENLRLDAEIKKKKNDAIRIRNTIKEKRIK
ncbi:hypothetical protein CBL_20818 [Carabus blaptoides fortunei]